MSCAHWQSTQALRLEGTIWIYGFWTGLNYVAAASGQTETKVDTAAVMVEVKKTCAQHPSQVLASAVWTAGRHQKPRFKIGEEFSFPFGAAVLCLRDYRD